MKVASSRAFHLIKDFEKAVKDKSWIGSKSPEEHEEINAQYVKARRALIRFITLREEEARRANK